MVPYSKRPELSNKALQRRGVNQRIAESHARTPFKRMTTKQAFLNWTLTGTPEDHKERAMGDSISETHEIEIAQTARRSIGLSEQERQHQEVELVRNRF